MILGEVFSGPVEARLADLLQAISSFLNTYPALTGDAIQPAVATLITKIHGKSKTLENLTAAVVTAFCSVLVESFHTRLSTRARVYKAHVTPKAEFSCKC